MLPEHFCEKMKTLLGPDYDSFVAALELPRAVGLRRNPMKTECLPENCSFLTQLPPSV